MIKRVLLIFFTLLIAIGVIAFFRISNLLDNDILNDRNELKGRQLLQEMGVAHHIQNWSFDTYSVTFEEEFIHLIGTSTKPFKENKSQFVLDYALDSYDGRLTFLSGLQKDEVWGLQSWQSYKGKDKGELVFKKDKDVVFWIPTYQYFIEFPRAIQKATAVSYVGESEQNGVSCYGVLASWGSIEPQRGVDQYLIWIDKETKRIVNLEYTIRELYPFLTGVAHYTNYKDFNGIILPTVMPVGSNLISDGYLHQMSILDFKRDKVSVELLRPDKQLPLDIVKPGL